MLQNIIISNLTEKSVSIKVPEPAQMTLFIKIETLPGIFLWYEQFGKNLVGISGVVISLDQQNKATMKNQSQWDFFHLFCILRSKIYKIDVI